MSLQKILLRVVFGSLGLAACFGAAAVLFVGHDTLWRIGGTCALTAVGAFLLFAASSLFEREETRQAGVLATALILAEYLLILGQIWSLFGRADEQAEMTIFHLAATGVAAIAFLALRTRPETAVAARVGLAVSGAVLALLTVGTWGPGWGTPRLGANRWFEVSGFLAQFGLLAVLALPGAGRDRRYWRWAGVAAAGTAFAIATREITAGVRPSSALFVCITSLAVVAAHANAMMLCPLRPGQRWLRAATIGAAIATGALVDLGKLTSPWQEEMLGRLAGAAAILAGCGTLALLVLARINRRMAMPGRAASELREIVLFCPRCGTRQTIPLADGRCPACGLGIAIRLEEPPA